MKAKTSIEQLAELYFAKKLSPAEIAKIVGYADWTSVCRRLRLAGYKLRNIKKYQWNDPKHSATEHPTTLDIAWAAGLYEGEGSCLHGSRDGKYLTGMAVSLSQKDRWILDRLRALFGGTVKDYTRHVTGHTDVSATYHYWRLDGLRSRGFLMTIFKFLSPKRQAQVKDVFGLYGIGHAAMSF